MKILAYLLIIFGLLCYGASAYYLWIQNDPNRLAFNNYPSANTSVASASDKNLPQRVIIKDLQINIPLIPAHVKDNTWETTENGASYLTSSPIPGTDGNSIIYGHNWPVLLGNLIHAQPGQTVEIIYADGSKKKFVIEYTSTVSPTQSSILAPSKDKRITIYTCSGFLDSKRFVVVALYDDEEPSFSTVNQP